MPIIALPLDEVVQRGQKLRKMLKLISRQNDGPAWKNYRTPLNQIIIGFFDSGPADNEYSEWRFKTRCPGLLALYYERWQQDYESTEDLWYLDRAYFHLYEVNRQAASIKEYIALHCEPNGRATDTVYQRSPHLHIKAAPDPLPKAHFALNAGHLDVVLNSCTELTTAIEQSVALLRTEVLDRICGPKQEEEPEQREAIPVANPRGGNRGRTPPHPHRS